MFSGDKIIKIILDSCKRSAPVVKESNLYYDLGFDSLAFIQLLVRIEKKYSIQFSITEMEECLRVGRLLEIVEEKLKERS
jgi:acyl carrier protein